MPQTDVVRNKFLSWFARSNDGIARLRRAELRTDPISEICRYNPEITNGYPAALTVGYAGWSSDWRTAGQRRAASDQVAGLDRSARPCADGNFVRDRWRERVGSLLRHQSSSAWANLRGPGCSRAVIHKLRRACVI
jgi:hypothetical protein